ncbi:hypothetical protein F441_10155 [Phytophthora nicotianae CJ01A1]|uniref:Jacalin-type lectin domain-containing protein n=5 Tax=Phytophthora nicotianae TaxID=4792 RepID=W2R7Y7_PHYN3|nr:hypothetical protein PPTG_01672 [Phytophthora nicotianae INRA-310]ETI45127.1 hypothetical protein F443_10221 [Phytophthora nicotianae P1569]ETK85096.1 hypothetical protein L915_09998 [Phytophthora nicotianae]ETP14946.1 hypothetical protein F441_10155 [Phytophthora nicotianae CJ01A1]ETP43011.1 hypothetical protein F442_10123 [Phytophthora nicotianae P10297]ETL38521.1 hypothetical protein L916_09905 [Phytophthora nicotianae]
MVRCIFQVLVAVVLVAGTTSALDFGKLKDYATDIKEQFTNNATDPPAGKRPLHPLLSGLEFGGTGNDAYEYRDAVEPGEVVKGVTIRTGKRVNGIGIIHQNLAGEPVTNYVGGEGGDPQTLTLNPGEYIISIEAHTGEKDGRKRISYIKLTTNKNNSISGGTPTNEVGKESAQEGYQVGGFYGKRGDELDSVAAIWATILP